MLRLHLLGDLALTRPDGAPVASVLRQAKRLALLVYLVLAGPGRFVRRSTLLALFWPELDEERGRHALRQALYFLRRSAGNGLLESRGSEELGVDPAHLWCDVLAFQEALAGRRHREAMALYQGDLLAGFSVDGMSSELEQWIEDARARLRERAAEVAWRLTEEAAEAGEASGVRHWGRRALELSREVESGYQRLIELFDSVGDRAAALSTYRSLEERLGIEFETEPSPETTALVERVRARRWLGPLPATPSRRVRGATLPRSLSTLAVPPPSGADASRRRTSRLPGVGWLGAALACVFAAMLWVAHDPGPSATPVPTRVAVLPFALTGDPALGYLREGLVHILSANLDGAGDLTAVDSHAVLEHLGGQTATSQLAVERMVRRFHSQLTLVGTVSGTPQRLRITASLRDEGSPRREVARAMVEGPESDMLALVDQLTSEILLGRHRGRAPNHADLSSTTTSSLPALKAYLRGEESLRAGRLDEARDAFLQSVGEDPEFALAHYRLALTARWTFRSWEAAEATAAAAELRSRLPSRERLLVDALVAFQTGAADRAEEIGRTLVGSHPTLADAWYQIGEVQKQYNPVRGRSITEARGAFHRAMELDPYLLEALYHEAQLAAFQEDGPGFLSLAERVTALAPRSGRALSIRALVASRAGDSKRWARAMRELRGADDFTVLSTASTLAVHGRAPRDALKAAALLADPLRSRDARATGYLLRASLFASLGQWGRAFEELQRAEDLDPLRPSLHRAHLTASPMAPVSTTALEILRSLAVQGRAGTTSAEGDVWHVPEREIEEEVTLYVAALLSARVGDTERAEEMAAELDTWGEGRPGSSYAGTVRGLLAWQREEARDVLRHVSADASGFPPERLVLSPFFSQPLRRFLRAEALRELGHPREAVGWYEGIGELSPHDLVLLGPALLGCARAHEELGEIETALDHYDRVLDLWSDADAELEPWVEETMARRAALAGH